MRKTELLVTGLILSLLGLAHAATEVEIITERIADGEKQAYTINAVFQGKKSRYSFHPQNDADSDSGTYLLSLDGEETAYFLDTNENSCYHWNNEELAQSLSSFLLKTTDRFKVKTTDGEIVKVFEKDVESIHGLPAKHIRINIRFTTSYKYMFFKDKLESERITDIWVTPNIEGIDAQPLFQSSGEYTGNKKLDQNIRTIIGPDAKHRLRSEVTQTTIDKKGEESSIKLLQYVKSITEIEEFPDENIDFSSCINVDSKMMEKTFKALLKELLG